MKILLVTHIHSVVDLITNSSSELFVCNKKQSIKTVKDVLRQLAKLHNEMIGPDAKYGKVPEDDTLFTIIFKKPTISKYTMRYWRFPENLREEYEKYNNMHRVWESCSWGGDPRNYENSERYKKLKALEEEARKKYPTPVYKENATPAEKKKYELAGEKWLKVQNKIWADWAVDSEKATLAMFKWFLADNGIPQVKIDKVKSTFRNISQYPRIAFKDEKLAELYEIFSRYLFYDIKCQKGDILIESAGDNSIPHELVEIVCTYMGGQRWHLG
jgi:hypothetical protein